MDAHHFLRQHLIGLRAPGPGVIGADGLAVAGGLGQAHVPGNDGGVDLAGEVALDLLRHLEGLSDLLSTVRIVKSRLNPAIQMEGLLLTMYDGRTNLSMQVAEEVKRHFPGKVFATVIPRNVRLSEAPSHGKPVNAYDGASRGSVAYKLLAEEFLKQNPLERKE